MYFMAICYIFPVLVCCTKKNLAALSLPPRSASGSAEVAFSLWTFFIVAQKIQSFGHCSGDKVLLRDEKVDGREKNASDQGCQIFFPATGVMIF
jgi:hypothetical protein